MKKKKKHKNFKIKHAMSLEYILGCILWLFHCFQSYFSSVYRHALHSGPSVLTDRLLVGVGLCKIMELKQWCLAHEEVTKKEAINKKMYNAYPTPTQELQSTPEDFLYLIKFI